ncbi:hypothetical protein EES44_01810 [Streptomyces sp. ADI96-15]|nr:hypothetical protein EES44_01810 [Streptomyces sp. ADI96-15]
MWWAVSRSWRPSPGPSSKRTAPNSGPVSSRKPPRTRSAARSRAACRPAAGTGARSRWVKSSPVASGAGSCTRSPSRTVKRERSAGCRSARACTAPRTAATSASGSSRRYTDMVTRSGAVRYVSWNQRWIGVSGAGPAVTAASGSWPASAEASAAAASCSTVCRRKTSREVSRSPAARARVAVWMLRMESPPRSKKLSSTPTRSTPSSSHQMAASVSSVGVRGAVPPDSAAGYSGAGSAFRSSLPLAVSGSASSRTTAAGTMWSGRLAAACSRSARGSGASPGTGTA